jgi:hypothetical protein
MSSITWKQNVDLTGNYFKVDELLLFILNFEVYL